MSVSKLDDGLEDQTEDFAYECFSSYALSRLHMFLDYMYILQRDDENSKNGYLKALICYHSFSSNVINKNKKPSEDSKCRFAYSSCLHTSYVS